MNMDIAPVLPLPNLTAYDSSKLNFTWETEISQLSGLPDSKGYNLAYECLDRHCTNGNGSQVAIHWRGRKSTEKNLSYRAMMELTNQFAQVLTSLDIKEGDVVFSLLGRVPELYITALGALKTKAIFSPLFYVFGPEPIAQWLIRGNGKILVTTLDTFKRKVKSNLSRLKELNYVLITDIEEDVDRQILSLPKRMKVALKSFSIPATSFEDPALLHFTSGTTGMPKGALHTHRCMLVHSATGRMVLDFKKGDQYWCTADPGWVTGTSYGILSPLIHGVTVIVEEEDFDADRWLSLLESCSVNIWYTSPTAFRRLMRVTMDTQLEHQFKNLRLILSVGEPLHPDAVKWGQKTFGVPVLDNWWQTETGGIMISNYRGMPVKPGSMGKPIPGIQAAVAELKDKNLNLITEANKTGLLVLKKGWPSMFTTYWQERTRYEKCFHGDWYITGDLAQRDGDGYFWFIGRSDDMIKTSGHLVGPFEVERVLMQHDKVSEAAIIGKPEPIIGELIKGFVVLKPGAIPTEILKNEILAFGRRHLGPTIAPRQIEFIQGLPKTRSGKILRRLLKARELGFPEGDLSTLENG